MIGYSTCHVTTPGAATQWLATFHLPPRSLRSHIQTCVHYRNRPAHHRISKVRAELRRIKDLHAWRNFILDVRKRESKKNRKIESFLETCLDDMKKKHTAYEWKSLIRGFKDILMFTTLKTITVRRRKWFLRISPSVRIGRRFWPRLVTRYFVPARTHSSDDDQNLSTVEILFELMGTLNNLFDYKSPLKP